MSLIGDTKRDIIESLADTPKHGYDLHDQLDLATSTIYNHLEDLEDAGMVTSEPIETDGGRKRNVYSLTPAGEQLLEALQARE